VALVALVTGPGVLQPFWEVRKPYQPTSDDWHPMISGVSRAVWIDVDRSHSRESSLDYAQRVLASHKNDIADVVKSLASYDSSVTMHVLNLLRAGGTDVRSAPIRDAFTTASANVVSGYSVFNSQLH
jgi:hypothetical protein